MDINLAALSDILFNKVKHLGHFLGNLREISPDKLCFNGLILTQSEPFGLCSNYVKTKDSRIP